MEFLYFPHMVYVNIYTVITQKMIWEPINCGLFGKDGWLPEVSALFKFDPFQVRPSYIFCFIWIELH